ncbi:MAG TPA: class I SAM-dependent methyltransferase [Gemmatimonadaceae bacterium]
MRGLLARFARRDAAPPPIPMPPLPSGRRITSVDDLVRSAAPIPSMLSAEAGKFLYALCYMQTLPGDVVEIGSWQGYSTSFLARATRDSGNGSFFAIDHFRGNVGKEDRYVVGRADLSDLRSNFERNMRSLALWESVTLLDMPDEEAARRLEGHHLRFLFVDGDHTRAGVERDIRLFFPMLVPGAIAVFDDFSARFPGLVDALDHLLATTPVRRAFGYRNTLVVLV